MAPSGTAARAVPDRPDWLRDQFDAFDALAESVEAQLLLGDR
jgi:hypothetical protein